MRPFTSDQSRTTLRLTLVYHTIQNTLALIAGCATGMRGTKKWRVTWWNFYHNINSVCAQKVRIALKEKGQEAKDHILDAARGPTRAGISKTQSERVVPTLISQWRANHGIVADPLLHRRCLPRTASDA